MTTEIHEDYEAMSRAAARWLLDEIEREPALTIVVATGESPRRTYELLANAPREKFSQLRVVKLDEWRGLAMDDPGSCERYVREQVLEPLGIADDRYLAFDSQPEDVAGECERIELGLRAWWPFVCVLGIGVNGHLGLNEPGSPFSAGVGEVELSESSREHAMLSDARGEVQSGFTLGIANLLEARRLLVLASGRSKRLVVSRLLGGAVERAFPASALHLHSDVTLLCDRDAGGDGA